MLDLDIPFDVNPHVLLHWMQTDLTPATTSTSLATSNGTSTGFVLTNAKNTTAFASYISPGPPAKNPLSHRYTQILLDTSSIKANGTATLKAAAATRMGFDITTVLQNAGLSSSIVAGNSFNVTNPGPADDSTTTSGGTSGSKNSTTTTGSGSAGRNSTAGSRGSISSTGSASTATSSGVVTVNGAGAVTPGLGVSVLGLALSGVSFWL